jgi:glycyl-tRNA synthetase beta chain
LFDFSQKFALGAPSRQQADAVEFFGERLRPGADMTTVVLAHGAWGAPSDWDAAVAAAGLGDVNSLDLIDVSGNTETIEINEVWNSALDVIAAGLPSGPLLLAGYSLGARLMLGLALHPVVRPRLADAKFFFDQDRKKTLRDRLPGLAKVVYHNKLGTQGERVERVRKVAKKIGERLGGAALAEQADRAAMLCKADLLTDMVGEFPELQGIMGCYYAKKDGEPVAIAEAIEDHYKPRFSGDSLPRNAVGLAVALADKIETLVGLFGIGQLPTGDKDPFALRRHALGAIRMLTEKGLDLPLYELIDFATPVFGSLISDPRAALTDFVFDRLAFALKERGYTAQEVDAVVSLRPQRLADVEQRLLAVRAFAALPEAQALAAANKRIGNILKKSEVPAGVAVTASLLKEEQEKALHEALGKVAAASAPAFSKGDYTAALRAFAALRAPVDAFFDAVMVNAEDAALRNNRLALLRDLHALMNQVADLSRLAA